MASVFYINSHLTGKKDEYFPAPIKETLKDIISGFDGHPFLDRQESESTCRTSAEKDDDTSTPPT